ncbi:MAG: hypothetical protein J6328_06445 [Bacilli bacterium]|nr:hypothetical protein [Bacilli bacterium]
MQKNEEKTEVISHNDLMWAYYDLAVGDHERNEDDYDAFARGYYESDVSTTIQEYALAYAKDHGDYDRARAVLVKDKKCSYNQTLVSGGGGGTDGSAEDYILKSTHNYEVTPASCFARQFYSNIFDYSDLQMGDILYEAAGSIGGVTGHTALICDPKKQSAYGEYVQTIEAVQPCVSFGFIDDNRILRFNASIFRVKNVTYHETLVATNFMMAQIGKPYNCTHSPCNTSAWADSWYCSELVWAAYNSIYIDLSGNNSNVKLAVAPAAIKGSDKLELLTLGYAAFPGGAESYLAPCLKVEITGKSGSSWKVKVRNYNKFAVTVLYNSKMCFLDDAKNWNNLSNVQRISCGADSYSSQFTISENWFADSIGISFLKTVGNDSYRFITYGKNLNASSKTLSQWRNMLVVS